MSVSSDEKPKKEETGKVPPSSNDDDPSERKPRRRQRGKGRGRNRNKSAYATSETSKFKGETEDMNGHVFQVAGECGGDNQKQFLKTMEALEGYASKNLEYAADIKVIFTSLSEPVIPTPEDHPNLDQLSALQKRMWTKRVDKYMDRLETLESNKDTMWSVIWGQCSKTLQTKLTSLADFKKLKEDKDCLGLVKHIMGASYRFDATHHPYESVYEAKKLFYATTQRWDEPVREYGERFNGMVEMLDSYDINVCEDECLLRSEAEAVGVDPENVAKWTDDDKEKYATCKTTGRNRSLAMAFIKGSCQYRFGALVKKLQNDYLQGDDKYPTDVVLAQHLLTHYKKPIDAKPPKKEKDRDRRQDKQKNQSQTDDNGPDLAFAQSGRKLVAGTDGKVKADVKCPSCNEYGHMKNECPNQTSNDSPDTKAADMNFFQHDFRGSTEGDGDGATFLQLDGHDADFCFILHDDVDDAHSVSSDGPVDVDAENIILEFSGLDIVARHEERAAQDGSSPSSDSDSDSSTGSPPPLCDRDDDSSAVSSASSDGSCWDLPALVFPSSSARVAHPPPVPSPSTTQPPALSDVQVERQIRDARVRYRDRMMEFAAARGPHAIMLHNDRMAELDAYVRTHPEDAEFMDILLDQRPASSHVRPDLGSISFAQTDASISMSRGLMGLPTSAHVAFTPAGVLASSRRAQFPPSHYHSDATSATASVSSESSIASLVSAVDFAFLEVGSGAQPRRARVNPFWILLDSESTVSIFCNPKLLRNIRKAEYTHRIYSNGGYTEVSWIGDVPNFGTVWYNPDSLANILSLAAVRRVCRVVMDSASSPCFQVFRPDGQVMRFVESRRGLYFYDASPASNSTKPSVTDYSFINTVAKNERQFSPREIEGAKLARILYRRIGRPSHQQFLRILNNNEILNCPITSADAQRAQYIYGPDVATLKGKTVRSSTEHVPAHIPIVLPDTIKKFHLDVTLCADIFKVQGIRFLHTISRKIQLRSVEELTSANANNILSGIQNVTKVYKARGFNIIALHADNDFSPIEHSILPIRLNTCAANEHVGEVERSIRTVKNSIRSTIQGLPFRRYTKQMVRSLVKLCVSQLNTFVAPNGISDELSPRAIVMGDPKADYNKINQIGFGEYVQTHEEPDPSNTMEERTTGAIALRPIGNTQGGFYFLSLNTWRVLKRRKWTPLPMPQSVIEAIHDRAKDEGQPTIKNGNLEFTWESSEEIIEDENDDEDENEDESMIEEQAEDQATEEQAENQSIGEMNEEELEEMHAGPEVDILENQGAINNDVSQNEINEQIQTIMEEENVNDDETIVDSDDDEDERSKFEDQRSASENADATDDDSDDVEMQSVKSESENHEHDAADGYNLRRGRKRDYTHMFPSTDFSMLSMGMKDGTDGAHARVQMADMVFTQMSARKGIAKHGQVAIDAMVKEYAQLDALDVFKPLDEKTLTSEQKKNALGSVDLIKEKRCGKIKGRTCADGRPQRAYIPKEDTTSPTISLEALIMTLIIDAKEKRDVATADISGAFLRGTNEDFDVMKVVGQMVDNVVAANPTRYERFVCYENGKKVLYLQLVKAMYGLLKAAIIWWKLFSGHLEKMGFVINPYDKCVANKIIDGKQCTIGWYVDDIKVSHEDTKVVDKILEEIEKHFDKLTITRGAKHVYVGMNIEFLGDGRVQITCKDYIEESIEAFGEDIKRTANTPAKKDLFEIDENSPLLKEERADIFHSVTAKLLWVSRRARLDIQTAIAFLCTRVQAPTDQDWGKLRRTLQYLKGTLDMPRIISGRNMHIMNTYVDAAYAVHMDMKSHTGGCISVGDGIVHGQSKKQSLNTKSSTEAEVVGASDYLPFAIWYKYFLEHQGQNIEKYIFHQDNQSAIKLEKNGIDSARQRSRHINIRYFFIKERTKSLGFDISHCPTAVMLGDFFTKPLQGSLFRKFRDVIQGLATIEDLIESYMSSLKERVGKSSDDQVGLGEHNSGETMKNKNDHMTDGKRMTTGKMNKLKDEDTESDDVAKMKRSYADVVSGKFK